MVLTVLYFGGTLVMREELTSGELMSYVITRRSKTDSLNELA